MKSIRLYIGILSALWMCACSETKQTKVSRVAPEVEDFQPEFHRLSKEYIAQRTDSIRSFFYNNLELNDLNGMFLIAKNGRIIFEHYQGHANEAANLKMSAETPVHVASISKVVTAVAVLRLVDQEKIELDTDIRSYLPEIPYEGVTVRTLLNHRSGIPYYGYFPVELWPYSKTMTNRNIVELLNRHRLPLYFPPNTQFSYCNTNYALLALIVEKVTGKEFPVVMEELIFKPLKMNHSFIFTAKKDSPQLSKSYDERGRLEETTNLDYIYGDKNLYTTARDLLLLDRATYSDAFLSKKVKAEMFKGYSYEHPGKSNYGLGIRMREEPGKSTFFFHTGWWHGNTGCYATLRADTVCMIVLSNHYTKKVFGINRLSTLFGSYPFAPLIDTKENFIQPSEAIERLKVAEKK